MLAVFLHDCESGKRSLTVERGGKRISIADIVRSGVGARDDLGDFAQGLDENELCNLGAFLPPLHAMCRSTSSSTIA